MKTDQPKPTTGEWTVHEFEDSIQLRASNGVVLLQHDNYGTHHVRLFKTIADAHKAALAKAKDGK